MKKNKLKNSLYFYSSLFSLSFLQKFVPLKTIFPFYHSISDNSPVHLKHLYKIKNISDFKTDLDYLLNNFNILTFDDVKNHFLGIKKILKPSFFLTFDDGLSEIYDVVAPLLKEKGISAVFFVNSDFVDNKDMFFRYKLSVIIDKFIKQKSRGLGIEKLLIERNLFKNTILNSLYSIDYSNKDILYTVAQLLNINFEEYLRKNKPYLTTQQLLDLQEQGFIIGSHSKSHPLYKLLTVEEQLYQTIKSVDFVEEIFSSEHKLFAFPFTDDGVNSDFFMKLYENNKIDFSFGTAGLKEDSFQKNIQRIPMENNKTAKQILKYEYFYYVLKRILNKNQINRN